MRERMRKENGKKKRKKEKEKFWNGKGRVCFSFSRVQF